MKSLNFENCHFHKVDSWLWASIRSFLHEVQRERIVQGAEFVTLNVDAADFDNISSFVEQMDTAYLHPRRDSAHIHFLAKTYSSFRAKLSKKRFLPSHARKKPKSEQATLPEQEGTLRDALIGFVAVAIVVLISFHINYLFTTF